MTLDVHAQRLVQAGLALFVFGLALGFAIPGLPNPRAALSAHLNAVQSGTFLLVLGLLWSHLAVWPRASAPIAHAIWISFLVLEVGMVVGAFVPRGAPGGGLKLAAQLLNGGSAVVMMAAVGVLVLRLGRLG